MTDDVKNKKTIDNKNNKSKKQINKDINLDETNNTTKNNLNETIVTENDCNNKNTKDKNLNEYKTNQNAKTNNEDILEKNDTAISNPKHKTSFKEALKVELTETKLLLKAVPSWVIVMFTLSVVLMNLFANKSIDTGVSWLALDCGIILSWASFLSMDIMVKRFGAKASTKISILVLLINLFISVIFLIVANISGFWGEYFSLGDVANSALNNTLSSSWYVIVGSSTAFICSAIINNGLNALISKCFKNKTFVEFSVTTYLSTFIGQFVDNLIFAFIVSLNFFGWSVLQCVTCALTGATIELLFEVIFSPIGYKVCQHWNKNNVGKEYLDFINNKKA